MSRFGEVDLHLFAEGTHGRVYDQLGAHVARRGKVDGVEFAVWAPNAASVDVIGDFEDWGKRPVPLALRGGSGVWEGFIPSLPVGTRYKYRIQSRFNGYRVDKADPYAFASRAAARDRVGGRATSPTIGATREWMASAPGPKRARRPDVDLRGSPRLVDARTGRETAGSPTESSPRSWPPTSRRCGLHARRAPARHRAPVLRLVGIPGDRLFRAHLPLRDAAGFHVLRRSPASARASA